MKLPDIDAFFKRFAETQIRNRWLILIAFIAIGAVCAAGLSKVTFESDIAIYGSDQEQQRAEARFNEIFSSDSILVLITADDVFDKNVLAAVDELGRRLEREVPQAFSSYSLLTVPVTIGDEYGIEIENPFYGRIPDDDAEMQRIKSFFLSRESLVNVIVSDDAKETWIALPLEPLKDNEFKRERAAQKIIMEEAEKYAGVCSMYPIGPSYIDMESEDYAKKEAAVRVSIGFAVMLVVLIALARSFAGVAFSLLATVLGIGAVFGVSSFIGVSINTDAVSLPILLGMALSIGYSIHIINSFKLHFRRTGKRKESAIAAVTETGWPILFTAITTVASLASFLFFGVSLLRWVGSISGAVVLAVYLYVFVMIPIALSFGKDSVPQGESPVQSATKTDLAFEKFGRFISKKRLAVSIISAIVIAATIPGITHIYINMDMFEMQGPKVPHVARMKKMLSHKLGSIYSYDIMLEYDNPDAFKEADKLLLLDEYCKRIGGLRLVKKSNGKPRVSSACDMLKEMNRMFNNDDPECYKINEEEGVAAQNLVFYADNFATYFDVDNDDFGMTRIHVELTGYDSKKTIKDIADIKAIGRELFPDARIFAIGRVIDYARTNETLVVVELKSILLSFLIIAVMMIVVFASLKTGLIAMVPNVAPVLVLASFMGYLGKPLDILTVTVMPLVLGLAVDDTIHLTNHIKHEYEKSGSYADATAVSFREIGKTMCMTTVILCAMFAVYLFSPLRFFVHVGLLSIIGIGSALVADYTLTPALICLVKPFGKEKPCDKTEK